MTKIDAFFDEYETVFEIPHPSLGAFRRSTRFPNVNIKLCGSDYHPPDVGVDLDFLFADESHRGRGLEEEVLEFVKELAQKHGLVLESFTLKPDEQARLGAAGFVGCERGSGYHEWPECWHSKNPRPGRRGPRS